MTVQSIQHRLSRLRSRTLEQQAMKSQEHHPSSLPELATLRGKVVKCFQTFQWKYDIDCHSPWWKKLYFHWIYLPFVRFSWDHLHIVSPERELPDGTLIAKDWQGAFLDEWKAIQESAKYPYGGYSEVAFDWSEMEATTEPRSFCHASRVDQRRYKDRKIELELAPLELLQKTLIETKPQIESLKTVL